jgi:hypothetical protein
MVIEKEKKRAKQVNVWRQIRSQEVHTGTLDNSLEKPQNYQSEWIKKNPDYMKKYLKEWKNRNKEKQKHYRETWNKKHPSYMKDYLKEWNSKNKEKRRQYMKIWKMKNLSYKQKLLEKTEG